MRWLSLAALLTLVAQSSTAQKSDPQQKPDPELMQGEWMIVGLEAGGKAEPERNYRGNTFTFVRDKAILKEGNFPAIEFALTLDPARNPKAIDLMAKGSSLRGIYKLDGDDLVLCISVGGARPTEFVTKSGGDTEAFTLKRSPWEKYADRTFGFTIEMPGKPEERVRKVDLPTGSLTNTVFAVHHDGDRLSYLVSVMPLPGKLDGKEFDQAMETGRKAMLTEMAGTAKTIVETDREFKAGAYVGRELFVEIEGSKEKGFARARLFVADDHLYGLLISGVEEGPRSRSVDRFWGSFKLLSDKK